MYKTTYPTSGSRWLYSEGDVVSGKLDKIANLWIAVSYYLLETKYKSNQKVKLY